MMMVMVMMILKMMMDDDVIPQPQVGAAMSVLSEMGRLNVSPDATTYHLIIKILIQTKERKGA